MLQLPHEEYECDVYICKDKEAIVEKELLKLYLSKYEGKLQKLNNHYTLYSENDLFMFGNKMNLGKNEAELLMQLLREKSKPLKKKFNKVFIYDAGYLYVLNIDNNDIKEYFFDDYKIEQETISQYK